MSSWEQKIDKQLQQFHCSRYFPKFEATLRCSNCLERDVGGLLAHLGILHHEYQLLDNRRSILWEGIKAVAKREESAMTLHRIIEAVTKIRRFDALEIIFKFLLKHEKGKSDASTKRSWRWSDMLKFRKSCGHDDDVSMVSESTLRSCQSVLSVLSTSSAESSIPDFVRRCQDWVRLSQEHNQNPEGELYVEEGVAADEQNRNRAHLASYSDRPDQHSMWEENDNSVIQQTTTEASEIVVISNRSNEKDLEDGVRCVNYIRKHLSKPAVLLNLADPSSTIVSHLQNAKKIVVVLSTAVITLARQVGSSQRGPSQDYEFDALQSCIAYLVNDKFLERNARMVLVTFRKTCNYAELPLILKSKVYLMNDKKSRRDFKFRIAGKEQHILSPVGPLVELKPHVYSHSGKVSG